MKKDRIVAKVVIVVEKNFDGAVEKIHNELEDLLKLIEERTVFCLLRDPSNLLVMNMLYESRLLEGY